MIAVNLKRSGLPRVLNGQVGQTFIVDVFSDTIDNRGRMAHVRDYRYASNQYEYQIWSLGPNDYEIVGE